MLTIRVETNAHEVAGVMGRLFADQIPYSLVRAINDSAIDAQKRQRAHQRSIFTVRRGSWLDMAVKIKPFASKTSPFAILRVDPPGGQARADIITKFETERVKRPFSGTRLAIPVDARRSKTGIVTKSQRPRSFNFRDEGGGSPGHRVLEGDKRTFMIEAAGGRGGIFQRIGRGKGSSVRTLFIFRPQVPIRPNLNFAANIAAAVGERFEGHFTQRFAEAVRTAR